jgi:ATP-dependent Clp protease ATP-binding subunit ClpA
VTLTDAAVSAAVVLSDRYIGDRFLPDKAFDLIDTACSQAGSALCSDGECPVIDAEQIARVVSGQTKIPLHTLTTSEAEKLLEMDDALRRRVSGQEEAIEALCKVIRRARTNLHDPDRPIGSFMFTGPSGVGKTEAAKALAEHLFGSETLMIRIDMSEYKAEHNTSRLIGAPPGYVGYAEGGQLTEPVRRKPYSVVLLDEVEKAHHSVFDLLLQVLDDGRLTDSQGNTIDFRSTIVILTSNIGARATNDEELRAELRQVFRTEFLNRLDKIIGFRPLDPHEVRRIVDLELTKVQARVGENGMTLMIADDCRQMLADVGYDPGFGARPIRRLVETLISDPLAEKLLRREVEPGDRISADLTDRGIVLRKAPIG